MMQWIVRKNGPTLKLHIKLHIFAEKKHLSISTDKSKTMVFNKTGRLTKHNFNIKGEKLEDVQTFCYLGYEINSSGSNNHTINTLHDKAGKAMRPILRAIARFNIPTKISIKLFNSYVAPIMLYNVENWGEMTEKRFVIFHWILSWQKQRTLKQIYYIENSSSMSLELQNLALMWL